MTTYFVSRHPGAVKLAKTRNYSIDVFTEHLDLEVIKSDDIIIGNLPMAMAAEICSKGAKFFSINLNTPKELRGKELSPEELEQCSFSIEEFYVRKVEK